MSKDFKKKYMHPTRRKLVDMVHTGKYDKNATIGYEGKKETRKVGDVWEDEHHRYEKKEGFIVKTGKNSEEFQKIREYLREKSECKNSECKTIRIKSIDKKFIKNGGYCMDCTIEREHEIKTSGLWEEYQNYKVYTRMIIVGKTKLDAYKQSIADLKEEYEKYKVWTRMLIVGKTKLDAYRQSLSDLKEEYEMIGSDGKITETWQLPKPIEEVRAEINEIIEYGENEIKEIEEKRNQAFDKLREANMEHYL